MKLLTPLLAALVAALLMTGCAMTRYTYDPETKAISLWSYRLIIKEEKDLDVQSPSEWHLKAKSQPDPESVQLIERAFELGKQAGAVAVAP
jgi:hypothetical protein